MPGAGEVPKYEGEKLQAAVDDFLEYLHDDLPPGPPSTEELFDPPHLVTRSESEFRRLAEIGKRMVDEHEASKRAETLETIRSSRLSGLLRRLRVH